MTFLVGRWLERIKIPWIFSALLIGLVLAFFNPFTEITSSESFVTMAELGMYFLLFIIGFEIDFSEIRRRKGFIFKTTLAIILAEGFFGSLFVHYLFDVPWLISVLVAMSFATVGEAVLIPILDEFRLTKTPLGQTIIGIGVLDDIIEVTAIIALSAILAGTLGFEGTRVSLTILILVFLFALAFLFAKLQNKASKIQFKGISSFFLFVVFFAFSFIGIGALVGAGAVGAMLAGMSLRNFIPNHKLKVVEQEMRTLSYGLFAPIFFVWVGLDTDVYFLIKYPLLLIGLILMINATKIITSYLMGKELLGKKQALFLGVSLTVKFSTSIVIIKLLFERGLIPIELYSVLVGTTVLFKFIVPFLLSYMVSKWGNALRT